MNRSRVTFTVIIAAAVAFVLFAALLSSLSSSRQETSSVNTAPNDQAQPTPLPAGTVRVLVQSSDTKKLWMDLMAQQFNARNVKLSTGEVVVIEVKHTGQELNESLQPVMWSPANQSWIDEKNRYWSDLNGRPLISGACPPTVNIPLGIAMWRPMAQALGWPDRSISWGDISALATNLDGWAAYGHPEWGQFKFGHGAPPHSNSGRLSIVAEIHAVTGKTEPLTFEDVHNPAVREAVAAVQTAVYHYGRVDTALLDKMVQNGPDYLHAVTNYEGNVIRWNREHAADLAFPFVLIYPADGTFWVEHPICVLDRAQWVTPAQIEGAKLFADFVTQPEQQAELVQFGIRPALSNIPLSDPFTPDNGVLPNLKPGDIPVLPYPPDDVMQAVVELWREVKKPSTVVLVLDISGSMKGDPLKAAVQGAQEFIKQMQPRDELIVITFNDQVLRFEPSGLVSQVGEELYDRVGGLYASGNTALYDATIESVKLIEAMRQEDVANGEKRIYGVVLMSDGRDTSSKTKEYEVLAALPDGTESSQMHLYTIAYGPEADHDLLRRLANRTNGAFYEGTTENISDIYFRISSEF